MKRNMMKFEKKFGWGEAIGSLALVLSSISLWQVHEQAKPFVTVSQMVPLELRWGDGSKADQIYVGFPLIITNNGGRAAALLQIVHPKEPAIFRVKNDVPFIDDPGLSLEYAVIDGVFNSQEELKRAMVMEPLKLLSFPQILNISIESGKSRPLTLVLKIQDKAGEYLRDSKLAFSVLILFSDGTTHRLAQGLGFDK